MVATEMCNYNIQNLLIKKKWTLKTAYGLKYLIKIVLFDHLWMNISHPGSVLPHVQPVFMKLDDVGVLHLHEVLEHFPDSVLHTNTHSTFIPLYTHLVHNTLILIYILLCDWTRHKTYKKAFVN